MEQADEHAARLIASGRSRPRVVVLDCGVKHGILRCLAAAGCAVQVVPSCASAEAIAAMDPDGLMLSNGPGDPEPVKGVIRTVRSLMDNPPRGRPLPIFGICLGQQILALALGGRTYKLKFDHHGASPRPGTLVRHSPTILHESS